MKTDILKLKAALVAIAMVGTAHAMNTQDNALETKINALQAVQCQHLADNAAPVATEHENEFIESMFLQIRDAVKNLADLIESFIDKNNKESFSAFINRCQDKITLIESNILIPLKAELSAVKAVQPGSTYAKILERTLTLAQDKAYKELQTLHTILDTHRKGPDAKKAIVLVNSLKPHLMKLTSEAELDSLDKKLAEIYELLVVETKSNVVTELKKLQSMVKEIKAKTGAIQKTVNIELLPIISAKLKRP